MPNQKSNPIDEIVAFFVTGPSREEIARFRLSDAAQAYVRTLLNKNTAGTLTSDEERELDKIMTLNDVMSLVRIRIQGDLAAQMSQAQSLAPTDEATAPHVVGA